MEAEVVGADGHTQERTCLNCGAMLAGEHCHACGQNAHVHRTITAFSHDLLHGVLHFEGKIWSTLPLLAWWPGELTRRYIDGQRARFVSPIALFLFAIFLLFAVAGITGEVPNFDSNQVKAEMAREAGKTDAAVKRLEQRRARAQGAGQPTATIDRLIKEERNKGNLEREFARSGLARGAVVRVSDDVPKWLALPLTKSAQNPELLFFKLKNNAYKYSWALIPISMPFMWLLFPFSRRFRLYDHMVFVTYSLSFMTLLLVTAILLGAIGLNVAAGLLMLVPPVHMYRQLKGAYFLSRWGAVWRSVLLVSFASAAVGLFAALLFALGLF